METADFLFPRDLEVTPAEIRKVLFVGSCLSEAYVKHINAANPGITCDHILFNNASDLPAKPAEQLQEYNLQYVQLPLRSVLTDSAIRIADAAQRGDPADWLAMGKANIDRMLEKAMTYNRHCGLLSVVSTFFVPQARISPSLHDVRSPLDLSWIVNKLNDYLAQEIRLYSNAYLADVDMIASTLGKRFFLDDFLAFYTHGSVHYPDWHEGGRIEPVPPFAETYENRLTEFFAAVYRQIEVIYRTSKQLDQVKLVIFDLDNTLWRGQLAEHYRKGMAWPHTHGWPLGVWEAVSHLRWRGIAVALASRNDREAVIAKWQDVVDPPFLRFDDFVIQQISWQPKADSIAAILRDLSLTAKSAVFVDDHPVEGASVRAAFPEIRVIGSNPYLTRRILLWSAETQLSRRTKESERREQMFSGQIEREQVRASMPREAFLASLATRIKLFELLDSEHHSFPRVNELVNKTNQFNTTTRRWTLQDYIAFWREGGRVFAFSVEDRFTDYGLVGVLFAVSEEVVQYVMSCRVLGMDVEIAALAEVVHQLRLAGATSVSGKVVPTELNTPCRDVYLRCGFRLCPASSDRFQLDGDLAPNNPSHIHLDLGMVVA